MEFITEKQFEQLLENDKNNISDPKPVVMLHIPQTQNIWLLTHVFQQDLDVGYGLILEEGRKPQQGCVWLYDLFANAEKGMEVFREPDFVPAFPISFYKEYAEKFGKIPEQILKSPTPDPKFVETLSESERVFLATQTPAKR